MNLKAYLKERKELVDKALREYIPPEDTYPPMLHRAMHYSLFADGKRIRPILHLAAAEACGGDCKLCLPFACALELIHTYSLIHDDLPALDDDELRRGKPTSHVVFGEAMAILAGDALLTEAFRLISSETLRKVFAPDVLLVAIYELAHAVGSQGMVGGQVMDILSEGKEVGGETIEYIHTHKTGALIRASVRTGAILSGAPPEYLASLSRYAKAIGLAFQIRDDLLDIEGSEERLGKSVRSDAQRGKATYHRIYGLRRAKELLNELVNEAIEALSTLDDRADPLREIARYMATRDR